MSGISPQPGRDGQIVAIDLVKVIAAQVIVWHHLVIYGPLARAARPHAEDLMAWLERDGRAAVYAFLVIGGFLGASALMPHPTRARGATGPGAFVAQVWGRYRRLAPTYLLALLVAMVAAAFARHAMNDADTPAAPGIDDVLAHVFLLQSLLDMPALSAGVWYVAADLLLFTLLAAIAWSGRAVASRTDAGRGAGVVAAAVVALALLGWAVCGRIEALDDWPVYFFGAYGLGVIVRWSWAEQAGSDRWAWVATALAIAAVALWSQARPQTFVAVAVALLLAGLPRWFPAEGRQPPATRWQTIARRWLKAASQRSYALFLIHYPVSLVAGALFTGWLAGQGGRAALGSGISVAAAAGLFLTWVACNLASDLLYRLVERSVARHPRTALPV